MNRASLITMLGKLPVAGNLLRRFARRYPEGSVVTIRSGRIAGMNWKRHHRYVNGYWIGTHEVPLQEALARELKAGQTFYDVGAHAGFFTLVGCKAIGPQGRCVAFEPMPENVESIREQIAVNSISRCEVVQAAVADRGGETTFCFDASGSSMGHLADLGQQGNQIKVRTMTLDEAVNQFGPPDVLKLDVEGAEDKVIEGASKLLENRRPVWVIELHGPKQAGSVIKFLAQRGYAFFELDGQKYRERQEFTHHVVAKPA